MQIALTLYYRLWFLSYKIHKMVDFQSIWNGWLEDVTLFPTEPNDCNLDFNDFLSDEKTNNEVPLKDPALSDLDWLDEKVDLSILTDSALLSQPNEAEMQMLDDAASFLINMLDDEDVNSSYLSSEEIKPDLNNIFNLELQNPEQQTVSLETACSASPIYLFDSEQNSPASVSSDTNNNKDSSTYDQFCYSPGQTSTCSSADSSDASSAVYVTVCDSDLKVDESSESMSIEDVANCVRKRRYIRGSKEKSIPKVHVSLKNVFHPYAKSVTKRPNERKERKKVQNKEAAARYRIKKRLEDDELANEVACLEKEGKELKSKHDDLTSEIKYLKSLMQEMFHKKGLL